MMKGKGGGAAEAARRKVGEEVAEEIRSRLATRWIPPEAGKRPLSKYTPEAGAELCVMRRAGMSQRVVVAESGLAYKTIMKWKENNPEFAQEWADSYNAYILDVAEELVPRAEALMKGLALDGRKLSAKQETRYHKALERLSIEAHWAATRRVPNLYGDKEGGGQFVLIQPIETPRMVTQNIPRAIEWKKEMERGETAVQDTAGADGSLGGDAGEDHSRGAERSGVLPVDQGNILERRHPRGRRPVAEPRE